MKRTITLAVFILTCAAMLSHAASGTVVVWGAGTNGSNYFPDYGQAIVPNGLSGVVSVSAGTYHTVALRSDGTVLAWGINTNGTVNVPPGLSGVIAIAGGGEHTLALKQDGGVVGWGYDLFGQATPPVGLGKATAISAGGEHSLVVLADGTVAGWGLNLNGEVSGTPTTVSPWTAYANPVQLGGVALRGVVAVAAGAAHSVALKNDGTVVAWGNSYRGRTSIPVGLSEVTAIAAGALHTVALKRDGTVVAWGDNSAGLTNVPVGLSGVTAIAAGDYHTVALKSDGTVMAWGSNTAGQTNVPVGLSGVTAIAAGGYHTVALIGTGPQGVAQSIYTPYAFTTLAGLAGSAGSVDGIGSEARFGGPADMAVDKDGNVYVADFINNTIRKVTPTGAVTTLAGASVDANGDGNPDVGSVDGTGSEARFSYPSSVAVDSVGNVYVADYGNKTIRKVTAGGVVTTVAGKAGSPGSVDGNGSTARFTGPSGIAVDSGGNVFVSDGDTIRKMTPAGLVTTLAGLAGTSGSANGIGSNARFKGPAGIAVDTVGNIFVADYGNYTIRKVTQTGVVTTLAGLAGVTGSTDGIGSAARFGANVPNSAPAGPIAVAVDSAGNVFVADKGNNTIRRVTATGVVTTLAGRAGNSGSVDGTGNVARFYGPNGIAVDSSGNLYVSDGNNTIRRGNPENVPAVIVASGSVFGFNGGQFRFNLTGPAGQLVVVEASTDFVTWLPLLTNTFSGTFTFADPQSSSFSHRYYRARTP